MNIPTNLSDAVCEALAAIKAIEITAGETARRAEDAERRAAEAVEQAESERRARDEALSKLSAVQQELTDALAGWAKETAILKAERKSRRAR